MVVNERIVRYYLRYVLLRCARYTNSKSEAERIALDTFEATCKGEGKADGIRELGQLVDSAVEAVGRRVIKEESERKGIQPGEESEMLFADERMRKLAEAMNMLERFSREVLVLYHMEMMSTKQISQIYNKTVGAIRTEIVRAEKRLAEHACELWGGDSAVSAEDACLWLDELSEALDLGLTGVLRRML